MRRRFRQVDVFPSTSLSGNPLAVVVDADGLSTAKMQSFTRWTNLSEAAFLLPPTADGADYRVRSFTLARELSFAGHPTLGACHTWLEAGGHPDRDDVIIQVVLGVGREVGQAREVLAQQPVGVLVGAALPRALGITEVDLDAGVDRKRPRP